MNFKDYCENLLNEGKEEIIIDGKKYIYSHEGMWKGPDGKLYQRVNYKWEKDSKGINRKVGGTMKRINNITFQYKTL